MDDSFLSGIERELVLQYLKDGNVPVTVTSVDSGVLERSTDVACHTESAVFPVAIKSNQIQVTNDGIIILVNPSQSILVFEGKKVRVEFYFNKIGLFFETQMKKIKTGLALVVPSQIRRIKDPPPSVHFEVSAVLYYSCRDKTDVNIVCVPAEGYQLFSKPFWGQIDTAEQPRAKSYLEQFITEARKNRDVGNGVFLISVCRFLSEETVRVRSIEGRADPLEILYINHERIVLGTQKDDSPLKQNGEYALKMTFPTGTPVVSSRDIFVTCLIEKIYSVSDCTRICAVCRYTSIKEEDRRYLYEKSTDKLLI